MASIFQTYKDDFSKNLKLAFPIMASQLGQITVNLIDNIMVGKLGAVSLAAVSLGNALFAVFMIIGMGITFALPPLVSNAHGAGETKKISQYFKHSSIVNFIFSLITVAVILAALPLLNHLGQDPEVVLLAKEYLYYSAWSIIPYMIFLTFRSYSEGLSNTVLPMIAMIAGNILNILFNYAFIFGKLGAPEMGVGGAAFGSLLARSGMVIIIVLLMMNWKSLWVHIKNVDYTKYQPKIFRKILNLGLPTSLQMFFEISAFSGAALIAGMVGKNEQAAHQIAINLSSVTFMICTGLAMASTIRVGNNLGKKDYVKLKDSGISAMVQVGMIMAVFSLMFFLLKDYLPLIYIDDPKVLTIASGLLVFSAIFQIPDGIQVTALSALRGLQDVKVPTIITLVSYYFFGIPISYFSALHFGLGAYGVWLGLLVGLFISASLLTYRFYKLSSKMIDQNISLEDTRDQFVI